ncbi:MAG: DNA-binding response regulator [Methyloceanibacter sp.]|nr:MAG: DNA-binding response regulator [Methyloceanibacter sp.]
MPKRDSHDGQDVQERQDVKGQTCVLAIDDHPITLAGLRTLLTESGTIDLHCACSFSEGLQVCRDIRPEIVVVDLAMRAGTLAGLSFIRRLRRYNPAVPTLVLSMHSDPLIAREALKAGANGYVVKDAAPNEITRALADMSNGKRYVSQDMAENIAFSQTREGLPNALKSLSARERLVLAHMAEGKSYTQIASSLALSYKAVAHICNRLKPKLGVQTLPELVHFAMRHFPGSAQRGQVRTPRD